MHTSLTTLTRELFHRTVRVRALVVSAIVITATVAPAGGATPALAATPPRVGIACTQSAGTNPTFTLTTKTGYITLPDANVMFMWGYSAGSGAFQHPGPVLCVNEGDTVTVVLHNTLAEAVSIVFPGQENVQANGQPAQPQFDGGGNLTSLTNTAAANGGSVTYSFVAGNSRARTYTSPGPTRRSRSDLDSSEP